MMYKWILVAAVMQVSRTVSIHNAAMYDRGSFDNVWWEHLSTLPPLFGEYEEIQTYTEGTTEAAPYFENSENSTNVTTQLGSTTFLHCKVNDLMGRTVSWLRRKGEALHLLTFGLHTYSSDTRYSLNYQQPNDWKLQITYANKRDEGLYECQVSTHPPTIYYVWLNVVVPQVDIVDKHGRVMTEKFYKTGSTIHLKCVISQVPHPSNYVIWKHDNQMLNYDTSRGGISVKTEMLAEGALSRLYIANANQKDSGNYTCGLTDVAATTIIVHVLNSETPAAMQHDNSVGARNTPLLWAILSTSILHKLNAVRQR